MALGVFRHRDFIALLQRRRIIGGQQLHEMHGKGFDIHHIILHRAGIAELQAHLRVLKLGPQDTGGVQQLQAPFHRDPLLSAGDAGPVLRLGGFSARHLIDKGGFSHVGDAHHHHPDGSADLALFLIPADLLLEQLLDLGGKLIGALPVFAVRFQHHHALCTEPGRPLLCCRRVRHIDAV